MPFASGPQLRYVGAGRYLTTGPTVYVGSKDVITIPPDFPTDLATIPRLLWAWLPPHGTYEKAAVLHDFGCESLKDGTCQLSSRDVDGLFRRVMRESGVGFLTRWVMWAGVRWGAVANPARRDGWLRDAPLVLLISALTLTCAGLLAWGADRAAHALIDLTR